jgi:hypothetical protein
MRGAINWRDHNSETCNNKIIVELKNFLNYFLALVDFVNEKLHFRKLLALSKFISYVAYVNILQSHRIVGIQSTVAVGSLV